MYLSILLLCLPLTQVQGLCRPEDIEKISNIWDGSPPKHILKKSVGTWTYLFSALPGLDLKQIQCIQTESNLTESSDMYYFSNPKKSFYITYPVYDNVTGVITSGGNDGFPLDQMYVVYLGKWVMGFYQCSECDPVKDKGDCYEPFVGIVLLHSKEGSVVYIHSDEAEKEMDDAMIILRSLGVEFPPRVNANCWDPLEVDEDDGDGEEVDEHNHDDDEDDESDEDEEHEEKPRPHQHHDVHDDEEDEDEEEEEHHHHQIHDEDEDHHSHGHHHHHQYHNDEDGDVENLKVSMKKIIINN